MSGPVPDLLPCPFCRGRARLSTFKKRIGTACPHTVIRQHVVCTKCGTQSKVFKGLGNAIAAWNTRTDPERDAEQAKIAALVEALGELIGCTMGGKVAGGDGNTYAIYPPTAAALAKGQAALALAKGEAQ